MTLPLPYVTMAVFCQEARQHPDGTLTLTNVLDRITVSEVAGRLPRVAPLVAVVGMRCDSAPGTHQIRLDVHQPSGASHRLATLPVEPSAEGDNIARILHINLDIHELGDYWVDVGWDDRIVTRMRLTVVRAASRG